jgi:hypothetical protein
MPFRKWCGLTFFDNRPLGTVYSLSRIFLAISRRAASTKLFRRPDGRTTTPPFSFQELNFGFLLLSPRIGLRPQITFVFIGKTFVPRTDRKHLTGYCNYIRCQMRHYRTLLPLPQLAYLKLSTFRKFREPIASIAWKSTNIIEYYI